MKAGCINFIIPYFLKRWMRVLGVLIFCFQIIPLYAAYSVPLTLAEATHLALQNEPQLERIQSNAAAFSEQAVADGQLSDPQLMLGTLNVPTDSFSFNQDEMTMVSVGVQQAFSPGNTKAIQSHQTKTKATAEQQRYQAQKLALIREVQMTWLSYYYWTQANHVIQKNKTALVTLLRAVKSQYSANKGNLSSVTQTELELSRLDNQRIQITQKIEQYQAQLGRWIGQDAERPVAIQLPHWPAPLTPTEANTLLQQHPLLKVDAAHIQSARDAVALAEEQYKPGIEAGVAYEIRQGDNNSGMPLSNMVSLQLTMDLPVFTSNRQDRRLKAEEYRLQAASLDQQAHYRDLLKAFKNQYAIWQQLTKQEHLYQQQLIPEAIQNAKATLLAYQNKTEDFATALRSQNNLRDIQLEQLQTHIERLQARAALFYLEGKMP